MSDLKQKTKIGMLWNMLEKVSIQIISFVFSIVLARLLTPSDYGTIGLLSVFVSFSNVFVDSGFSRALVQKQDRTEKDLSTAFFFSLFISIIIYLILYFASPVIAKFYKLPELVSLQKVLFLVIILNSLTVVQSALLQINVDFKKIAISNALSTIISGVLGIVAAYVGLGTWALVIQTISKTGVTAILLWIVSKWTPKATFSFLSFKQLFGFGSKLLISGVLSTIVTNINNLIIGKYYNSQSLGYYTRAQQFPDLISGTLSSVLNNSTFPLMASLQDKKEELVIVFKKLIKITSMFVFPTMIGLACLSNTLIITLLGEKWTGTSILLFWLSISYIFTPLSILNMNILNAIGRSDLFLKVDIAKIPIILITMFITFPISLEAIVIGKAITAYIYFYINAYLVGKFYNFGALKQLFCSWKYIISALIMGSFVIMIDKFIISNVLSLFLSIIGGCFVYFILLYLLKDEVFFSIFNKIMEKLKCNQ